MLLLAHIRRATAQNARRVTMAELRSMADRSVEVEQTPDDVRFPGVRTKLQLPPNSQANHLLSLGLHAQFSNGRRARSLRTCPQKRATMKMVGFVSAEAASDNCTTTSGRREDKLQKPNLSPLLDGS